MAAAAAAAGAVIVICALVVTVVVLRSQGGGCTTAAPVPTLPSELRSVGGFDQPYDVSDETGLEDVALRAATALHPRLIGTAARHSVAVAAEPPAGHDALLVPLVAPISVYGPNRVTGLVSFLRDCAGRAYFSEAVEVSPGTGSASPAQGFPALSREQAALRLGTDRLQLVYSRSPFTPSWRARDSGREIAAD